MRRFDDWQMDRPISQRPPDEGFPSGKAPPPRSPSKWMEEAPFGPNPPLIKKKRPTLRQLRKIISNTPLGYVFQTGVFERPSPELNLEYLGAGAYSQVFALDKRRALKIVKTTDSDYRRFVEKCLANRHHPHLPKIYWCGLWGQREVYIIERLHNHSFQQRRYLQEALIFIRDNKRNPFLKFEISCPQVKELAEKILCKQMGDLHLDNILSRADGTPVVIDPKLS